MLLIIAMVIGIAAFVILRPRQSVTYRPAPLQPGMETGGATGGVGNIMTGMMLSYLISNFLIDSHQYNEWRGLSIDELKDTLVANSIMTRADFELLHDQITVSTEVAEAQNQCDFRDAAQEYGSRGDG
jgi:hypothetical protein